MGNAVYLLLEFKDVADPQGNLGPDDKLSSVRVIRFDDLKPLVGEDLFPYIRLIHGSPSVKDDQFDPASLIRAVNGLWPLGKEKALRALQEYDRLATDEDYKRQWEYDLEKLRVVFITRILFERQDGDARMPGYIAEPNDQPLAPKEWPLDPLVLRNDIPFCLTHGYYLAGFDASDTTALDFCQRRCGLRRQPLRPRTSPLVAAEAVFALPQWPALFKTTDEEKRIRTLLRSQAIRSLEHLLSPASTRPDFADQSTEEMDRTWEGYLKDQRLMNARWDDKTQQFVAASR